MKITMDNPEPVLPSARGYGAPRRYAALNEAESKLAGTMADGDLALHPVATPHFGWYCMCKVESSKYIDLETRCSKRPEAVSRFKGPAMFKRLVHCLSYCRSAARREQPQNAADDPVKEVVRRLLVYTHLPMTGTGYVLGRASHRDIQTLAAFADVDWHSLRERIANMVD